VRLYLKLVRRGVVNPLVDSAFIVFSGSLRSTSASASSNPKPRSSYLKTAFHRTLLFEQGLVVLKLLNILRTSNG
jgi:hypothetical protein